MSAAEPAPLVYMSVPSRVRDPPDCGTRSAASRRGHRPPRGAAYLGPNLAPSSPSPLCDSRRRAVPGSDPGAGVPPHLLPPSPRAASGVSASLPDPAPPESCGGPPDVDGPLSGVGCPPAVAAVPGLAPAHCVGGVFSIGGGMTRRYSKMHRD